MKEIIDDIGLFTPEEQKQNTFLQPPGMNNSSTNNVQSLVERYRSISAESNPSYADISTASTNISREQIQFLPETNTPPPVESIKKRMTPSGRNGTCSKITTTNNNVRDFGVLDESIIQTSAVSTKNLDIII